MMAIRGKCTATIFTVRGEYRIVIAYLPLATQAFFGRQTKNGSTQSGILYFSLPMD